MKRSHFIVHSRMMFKPTDLILTTCVFISVDLSLYKDESQIEKKTSGKRKAAKEKADSGESGPAAKKRKAFGRRETPTARAAKPNASGLKASNAGSKSAKVI